MDLGARLFLLVLIALALFAAFFELGLRDVVEDNEGQRAAPPAEMLRSGDYVIPTLNGKDYLAKPPLVYWMIAGTYTLAGDVSPFLARVPTALCYVILVLSVYLYGRRAINESAGRIAALAVMTSPYVVDRARYAELDIPLTLFTFLAIIAMHGALASNRSGRTFSLTLLGGLSFGAAVMLKGPAPMLFLACAWIAWLVAEGRDADGWIRTVAPWTGAAFVVGLVLWLVGLISPGAVRFPIALALMVAAWLFYAWRYGRRRGRSLAVLAGVVAVGFAVAAPWAVAVLARKGWPFVMGLLQSEAIQRTHTATSINSGWPFYYLLGLLAMLAPWGLLLPAQVSRATWRDAPRGYKLTSMTGWLGVLLFSLIAGKEYEYVLPAAPFLLVAVGYQFSVAPLLPDWSGKWLRGWARFVTPVLAVVAVGFLVGVITLNKGTKLHAEGVLLAGVVLLMAWTSIRQKPIPGMAVSVNALGVAALCTILVWTLSQAYRYSGERSPRQIAEMTRNMLDQGYDVEAAKMTTAFDVFPGFAFHAGRVVPTTTEPEHILAKMQGNRPYYCVVGQKMLAKFPDIPAEYTQPLCGPYTKKKLIIIGNQPLPDLLPATPVCKDGGTR